MQLLSAIVQIAVKDAPCGGALVRRAEIHNISGMLQIHSSHSVVHDQDSGFRIQDSDIKDVVHRTYC